MPPQNSNPQPGQLPGPSLPQPVPPTPQPDGQQVQVVHPPEGQQAPALPQTQAAQYVPTPYPEVASGVPALNPLNISNGEQDPQSPKEAADRYAFFMESNPNSSKSKIPLPKKGNKFAWLIIGAAGLFIILGVAAVLLNSAKPSQTAGGDPSTFVGVINQQQEIVRVASLGEKNVESASLANFVATAKVATVSSQQELITYVNKRGVKIDSKVLAAYKADPNVDKVLTSAKSASVYDSTFRRVMTEMMTEYSQNLQRMEARSTDQSEREIIAENTSNAALLRTMLTE